MKKSEFKRIAQNLFLQNGQIEFHVLLYSEQGEYKETLIIKEYSNLWENVFQNKGNSLIKIVRTSDGKVLREFPNTEFNFSPYDKYNEKTLLRKGFTLNRNIDTDIIDYLEQNITNLNGYLKLLIRKDMEETKRR